MTPARKKAAKPKARKATRPAKKAAPKPAKAVRPAEPKPVREKPVKTFPVMSKQKFLKTNPSYVPLMKKLQDRRYEITGQVGNLENDLRDDMADNQNTPGDLADHGSGELNQHLSVTLMENDRVELERIDRALARFEDASYGRCDTCQKPIPMLRLRAIPWATRCIACQSRSENG
jgi:RNA polymerase-binding protein DksA